MVTMMEPCYDVDLEANMWAIPQNYKDLLNDVMEKLKFDITYTAVKNADDIQKVIYMNGVLASIYHLQKALQIKTKTETGWYNPVTREPLKKQ